MDAGILEIEGTVPYGHNNRFKLPAYISCYGPAHAQATVTAALIRGGIVLSPGNWGTAEPSSSQPIQETASPRRRLSAAQVKSSVQAAFDEVCAQDKGPQERCTPSPHILTPLYPHQLEALAWMIRQENSDAVPIFWKQTPAGEYLHVLTNYTATSRPRPLHGGLLADDMGLGKSLETLALIATNRPGAHPSFYVPAEPAEAVAPSEIIDLTEDAEGSEPVQPTKRQKTAKTGTRHANKGKEATAKQHKTKQTKPAAAGNNASATARAAAPMTPPAADGPKGTLILCPLSVLAGWEMQLEEHIAPGTLTWYSYHGANRDRRVKQLESYDIVLATYSTLAAEAGSHNGITKARWLRVVVDEAHIIKNATTATAKAAASLKAERRWALTGTPVQNGLADLHGILFYLKMEPLADKTLFRRTIDRPVTSGESDSVKRLQALVGSLALRRTKDTVRNGHRLVELPPRNVNIVPVVLSAAEQAKYKRWEEAGRRVVAGHLAADTLMQNYTAVLEIILRLRQICADSSLVTGEDPVFAVDAPTLEGKALTPEAIASLVEVLRSGVEDECPVCLSDITTPAITTCRHIYCLRCIQAVIAQDKASCPLCRRHITMKDIVELPQEPELGAEEGGAEGVPSAGAGKEGGVVGSKIAALLERLAASPGDKHIVFSQWTGMLDLVGVALQGAGIAHCRLDGKTSAKKRAEMLRSFSASGPASPRVFLISLKAGGVGLNLTAATHAHLLDPWWNPSVEDQAADRVHRLGQRRAVQVRL